MVDVTPMHFPETPLPSSHHEEQIAHEEVHVGEDDCNGLHDVPGKVLVNVVMNHSVLEE